MDNVEVPETRHVAIVFPHWEVAMEAVSRWLHEDSVLHIAVPEVRTVIVAHRRLEELPGLEEMVANGVILKEVVPASEVDPVEIARLRGWYKAEDVEEGSSEEKHLAWLAKIEEDLASE